MSTPSEAPSLETAYRPRAELQSTVMEGEAVIVDLKSNLYFTLNATGTLVWETLERGAPLREAVARLQEHFEVTEAQARADVESLAKELLSSGLIHPRAD